MVANVARGIGRFMHDDDAEQVSGGEWSGREPYLAMVAAIVLGVYLVGFVPGMAVFFLAFLLLKARAGYARAALLTAGAVAFLLTISWAMNLRLPEGLLQEAIAQVMAG